MLTLNKISVIKFFLHISKDEQKRRLESRLQDSDKHWKFSSNDLKERVFWDDYQAAFEDMINNLYCWRTSQLTASGEQRRGMKQALTSLTKILTQVIHGKGELSMYYSEGVVAVVVVVANSIIRLKAF